MSQSLFCFKAVVPACVNRWNIQVHETEEYWHSIGGHWGKPRFETLWVLLFLLVGPPQKVPVCAEEAQKRGVIKLQICYFLNQVHRFLQELQYLIHFLPKVFYQLLPWAPRNWLLASLNSKLLLTLGAFVACLIWLIGFVNQLESFTDAVVLS